MDARPLLMLVALAAAGTRAAAQTPAVPIDPVDGIVAAFTTHQVVMLPGGAHGNRRDFDLLLRLLRDSRTPGLVTDIVVECGTSRHQDMIDRFMRGETISDAAIRRAWQDTPNAGVASDRAEVEEFYHALRTVNASLPKEKQYRLLGGEPPIDWDNVVNAADVRKWAGLVRRRPHSP